jgi:prevent-host-death family protein
MTTASVAEFKARLSEFLAAVRGGDDVVVTDRGRPVARLTGLGPGAGDARLAELVRAGTVRPPRRTVSRDSSAAVPLLEDPDARLLQALLQEREQGR